MMSPKAKLAAWLGAAAVATGAAFITGQEGEVLGTYRDPIGIYTACVGETAFVAAPGDIKPGAKFTHAQCQERLYASMADHAEPVIRCTAPAALTTGQKLAFLSFSFNVGGQKFCGSTLAHLASQGDVQGSCAQLLRWTQAGGKELPGLVKRRREEHAVCVSG